MSIDEFRALINNLMTLVNNIGSAQQNLASMLGGIANAIAADNPVSSVLANHIQEIQDAQSPIYINLLRQIEITCDALGSDALN